MAPLKGKDKYEPGPAWVSIHEDHLQFLLFEPAAARPEPSGGIKAAAWARDEFRLQPGVREFLRKHPFDVEDHGVAAFAEFGDIQVRKFTMGDR